MVKGDVELNSKGYYLRRLDSGKLDIEQYLVRPFGTPFHSTGFQGPEDQTQLETLIFPNFSLGFGRERIDSDSFDKVDERRRIWDATGDTRWASGAYLPILEEDSTKIANDQILRESVNFRGNTIALWEHFDSPNYKVYARKYDGDPLPAWAAISGNGLVRTSTDPVVARDIIVTQNGLAALVAEADHINCYISGDQGATWTLATTNITANLLSDSVTANEDIDIGSFVNIGGVLIAAIWHESNATVTFFSSADGGDNWTDRSGDIITQNGPQGIAVMVGTDNEDKVYLALTEGLYEINTADLTDITSRLIFPMEPHAHNGRKMKVGDDGSLWFAQGVDNDTPPIVYRMTVANGERRIEPVPNDFSIGDGMPSDMLGTVRYMLPVKGMMYAAIGGGLAGRQARIVAHNGDGWHSMRKHGTANQQILWMAASPHDDDVSRLHYTMQTSSTVATSHFLAQAFTNPASGISIKREATGYIDLPYFDYGFTDLKTVLRVVINAKDLSASTAGEYINVDYGSVSDLGALQARTVNDLGNFLSGVRTISFASGVGLSALTLGLRINLLHDGGGTNTDTPVLKDTQIDALINIPPVEGHIFTVDLDRTAREHNVTPKTIQTQLKTARDLGTLSTFTWGAMAQQKVKVKPPLRWTPSNISAKGNASKGRSAPDALAQIGGFMQVVVEEPIQ